MKKKMRFIIVLAVILLSIGAVYIDSKIIDKSGYDKVWICSKRPVILSQLNNCRFIDTGNTAANKKIILRCDSDDFLLDIQDSPCK